VRCAKPESRADDVAVVTATGQRCIELERVGDLISHDDGSLALGRPPPRAPQRMARWRSMPTSSAPFSTLQTISTNKLRWGAASPPVGRRVRHHRGNIRRS